MGDRAPFTFQDLATGGSMIAAAPFARERFEQLIGEINDRFGLSLEPREDVYALLVDRLRAVAGRYWQETEAVDRKSVSDRLKKLSKAIQSVVEQLRPVRAGMHEVTSTEVVNFLVQAIDVAHRGALDRPREQLETILAAVEHLEGYCEQARAVLSHIPGKKGQRGLAWYVPFVELMTEVAARLGLKVTTAGDRRGDDPYATPFTVLVYGVETALPEKARSNLLSTCAKRIEDSRKRPKAARGKAIKP
jgi:hypothetical protein